MNAAERDSNRCRFHGARGGAPRGERHGNYRHGKFSLDLVTAKQRHRDDLADAREIEKQLRELCPPIRGRPKSR